MRLWRVLPWDPAAAPAAPGGPLFVPRLFQGAGRHDAPDRYGCLYLAEQPQSAVAEILAPFRGTGDLHASLLVRAGRRLGLAELELGEGAAVLDLDEPTVLSAEGLRPSIIATGHRRRSQAYALALFERHPEAAGLRWWSSLESSWLNLTLFDRAIGEVSVSGVRPLTVDEDVVQEAARHLGLA